MNTPNEVINESRNRWDLMLAVKRNLEGQLLKLNNSLDPAAGPSAEELQRVEDLGFDLVQLEKACEDAEHTYLTHANDSDPTKRGEDTA